MGRTRPFFFSFFVLCRMVFGPKAGLVVCLLFMRVAILNII